MKWSQRMEEKLHSDRKSRLNLIENGGSRKSRAAVIRRAKNLPPVTNTGYNDARPGKDVIKGLGPKLQEALLERGEEGIDMSPQHVKSCKFTWHGSGGRRNSSGA